MKPIFLFARLLSVLALLGLLVIPVSTVAAENAMASAKQATVQVMADMGDMPCCPDIEPAQPDCGKDCPLVIGCTAAAVAHPVRADWSPVVLHWSALEFTASAVDRLVSLAGAPPVRPPAI